MPKPLIIEQSTKGNIIYLVLSAFMTMLSGFCFLMSIDYILPLMILLKAIVLLGVVFFGFAFCFAFKRMRENQPLLVIDEYGFTDNTTAFPGGFTPWSEVKDIELSGILGQRFIEPVLKDEQDYLNHCSGLKRWAVIANQKLGHRAICITLATTDYSIEEVYEDMLNLFEESKELPRLSSTEQLSKTQELQ